MTTTQQVARHTPGPWEFEPPDRGDASVGIQPTPGYIYHDLPGSADTVEICTISEPLFYTEPQPVDYDDLDTGERWCGDMKANARLIAAAPELLEALRGIVGIMEKGWIPPDSENSDHTRGWEACSQAWIDSKVFADALAAISKAEHGQ